MTNKQLLQAFIGGATQGTNGSYSLHIDGDKVYSHSRPLIARTTDGFKVNADVPRARVTSQFINLASYAGHDVHLVDASELRNAEVIL